MNPADGSLSGLTGAPTPLRVGGRTLQLHPLTLKDFGRWEAWAQAQLPDAWDAYERAQARFAGRPAVLKQLLDKALELDSRPRPKLGSEELGVVLYSVEGLAKLLHLSVSIGDPSFTEADALAAMGELTPAQLVALRTATQASMAAGDPLSTGGAS